MLPDNHVWIFSKNAMSAAGGVFASREDAEEWIRARRLSGVLTAYPVGEGTFDWAMRMNLVTGRARERGDDSDFVASFTCASQEHSHYTDGQKN